MLTVFQWLTRAGAHISFKNSRGLRAPDSSWKSKLRIQGGSYLAGAGATRQAWPWSCPLCSSSPRSMGSMPPFHQVGEADSGREREGRGDQGFSLTGFCRSQVAGPGVTAPWGEAGASPGLYLWAIWPRRPPWGQL